jgi:hypothetical protein
MNIFHYSFLSFEASSSSSLPTLLGFLMNKWTKMNVLHHSFLSFENNQPFLDALVVVVLLLVWLVMSSTFFFFFFISLVYYLKYPAVTLFILLHCSGR